MTELNILHIAGFCIKSLGSLNNNFLIESFLKDVKQWCCTNKKDIDLICITGDIVYSGQKAEFDLAVDLINQILEVSYCKAENLFIVPGNHDVDRTKIDAFSIALKKYIVDEIKKDPEYFSSQILNKLSDYQVLLEKFDNYLNFINQLNNPKVLWSNDDSPYYSVRKVINNLPLRIIGLNNVIMSDENDEDGNILLGIQQFTDSMAKKNIDEKVIVLTHYPIDTLPDYERNFLQAQMSKNSAILLNSENEYYKESKVRYINCSNCINFTAGSLDSESDKDKFYNIITLNDKGEPINTEFKVFNEVFGWVKDKESIDVFNEIAELRRSIGYTQATASIQSDNWSNIKFVIPYEMPNNEMSLDRRSQLVQINNQLKDNNILCLHGKYGAGKSRSAVEYAYNYKEHFPAGVYWINGSGNMLDEFFRLAFSLGLVDFNRDYTFEYKINCVLNVFKHLGNNPNYLLIIDDLADFDKLYNQICSGYATTVLSALEGSILITTNNKPDNCLKVNFLEINKISREESLKLLLKEFSFSKQEFEASYELTAMLEDNLLLLKTTGSYISDYCDENNALYAYFTEFKNEFFAGVSSADKASPDELLEKKYRFIFDKIWNLFDDEFSKNALKYLAVSQNSKFVSINKIGMAIGIEFNNFDSLYRKLEDKVEAFYTLGLSEKIYGTEFRLHAVYQNFILEKITELDEFKEFVAINFYKKLSDVDYLSNEILSANIEKVLDYFEGAIKIAPDKSKIKSKLQNLYWLIAKELLNIKKINSKNKTAKFNLTQLLRNIAFEFGYEDIVKQADEILLASNNLFVKQTNKINSFDKSYIATFLGHTGAITCIGVTNDNKYIITGSRDKFIRVWDIETGKVVFLLKGHDDDINCLALSQDNKYIVSGADDHKIKVWDRRSGKLLKTIDGHSASITSVAISQDNELIVSGSKDLTLKGWNINKNKEIFTLDQNDEAISSVFINSDFNTIISVSTDNVLKQWDLETSKILKEQCISEDPNITTLISKDGYFYFYSSLDNKAKLVDIITNKEFQEFDNEYDFISSIALSNDNKYSAIGSENKLVKLFNTQSGELVNIFQGHNNSVESICFDNDNNYIVTGSTDNTIKLWETQTPDKQLIKPVKGHSSLVTCATISNDNKYIVTGSDDNNAILWDVESCMPLYKFEGHEKSVYCLNITSNNSQILTGSDDNTIMSWCTKTGSHLKSFKGHNQLIEDIQISKDNKYIISSSQDKSVKMWDLASGSLIKSFEQHDDIVKSAIITNDNKYVISGAWDSKVIIWNAESGKAEDVLEDHTDYITKLIISNDGNFLVSASLDSTVRIWDIKKSYLYKLLIIKDDPVFRISISNDNKYLILGSWNNRIRIWDIEKGKQIGEFVSYYPCLTYNFTNNDKSILALNAPEFSNRPNLYNLDLVGIDQINTVSV